MKRTLNPDAREFVEGIVTQLKRGAKRQTSGKIETLLRKVSQRATGEQSALVESAVPLTAEERTSLRRALEQLLGRSLKLNFGVNKALIAGLRIVVGDLIVDTSWEYQLNVLSRRIA